MRSAWERIGIMVAWITVIHQIGGASVAYLAGVLRIGFGTYFEASMLPGPTIAAIGFRVERGRRASRWPAAAPKGHVER